MFTGIVALGTWALGFFLLLLVPVRHKWKDDGECRGIVWHTIRNPTNLERFTLWRSKTYLAEDVQ